MKDASVWTSAGVTAGIDLALALIEEDYGTGLAQQIARDLVVHHRRLGGQSQFSTLLELEPASGVRGGGADAAQLHAAVWSNTPGTAAAG